MRIGFLINPIAGMGGRVGLKGTDDQVEEAIRRGAMPVAPGRANLALCALRQAAARNAASVSLQWLTCSGQMGEDALRATGFEKIQIVLRVSDVSTTRDTIEATRAFEKAGADLILFCGGDGTARDIAGALEHDLPLVGIPAGVKMYSGVFGATPAKTAEILLGFVEGRLSVGSADILDLDEERYRQGEWAVQLYQSAYTPYESRLTPAAKMLIEETSDIEVKYEIARELCDQIRKCDGTLFLLGPGSTVRTIADGLELDKTLLGIDAILGSEVVGRDLDEKGINDLLDHYPKRTLILSPIGAQGFVLGRGNLQLSPEMIRRIGTENLIVVATPAKLARTSVLRFDTGDAALDAKLTARGYLPVWIGYRRRRLVKVQR